MAFTKQFSEGILAIALVLSAVGCGSSSSTSSGGGGASMDEMAAQLEAQEAARQKEQARLEDEKKAQEAAAAAQTPPEPEVVTARSGKKGRSLEGGGYLSIVTGTRFWAENQMTLNVVRKNMDLYRGEHGEYPKTQEEFMMKIIEENLVKLPELPEGYEYYYDPEEPLVLKMINTGTGQPGAVD